MLSPSYLFCVPVCTGEESLLTLHCFLVENFDWIVSQLTVTPLLPANDKSSVTRPVLSLSQQLTQLSRDTDGLCEVFNPLKVFASIGHSQFNQVRVLDFLLFTYLFMILLVP